MPSNRNTEDIENNTNTIGNYNSILTTEEPSSSSRTHYIRNQRQYPCNNSNNNSNNNQSIAERRQRIILFAILVVISMTCVFISYVVSSVTRPTCSDRIVWMPNCNREEYIQHTL